MTVPYSLFLVESCAATPTVAGAKVAAKAKRARQAKRMVRREGVFVAMLLRLFRERRRARADRGR